MTTSESVRAVAIAFVSLSGLAAPLWAADYNGDGFEDLAVGVPLEDVGGAPIGDAGAVTVIYGSAGGLAIVTPAQFWSQNSPGVADAAEVGDLFGEALGSGDFNGDGFDDLAVGAPGEDLPGGLIAAGIVHVIYGSPGIGLSTAFFPPQSFTQTTTGVEASEPGDAFGLAVCSGDFNADGFDDLAVAAPEEDSPGGVFVDCGSVIVLYGTPAGLGFGMPSDVFFQSTLPAPDGSESGDHFGSSLTSGDFDANGADDLAVGSPGEDLGAALDAGAVHVIYGLPGAALATFFMPPAFIVQGSHLPELDETGDLFGQALAAGNFAGLGADALAIGAPGEDFAGDADAGMVAVVFGIPGPGIMPFAFPPQVITQDSPGVPEVTNPSDRFGLSLSAGDIGAGPLTDLLIGVPLEDIGAVGDCGAFHDFYGVAGFGLTPSPTIWHQNVAGVPEANGVSDIIARSVVVGDFNGDGFGDAAAGVPGEDVGGAPILSAGGVTVIYAAPGGGGLSTAFTPAQFWSQNSPGIPETSSAGDGMGSAAADD